MAITNYRIDKIDGRKDKQGGETVDVKESFAITDIVKKSKTLEVSWSFDTDYKSLGKLSIAGALTFFASTIDDKIEEKTIKGKKMIALKGEALREVK